MDERGGVAWHAPATYHARLLLPVADSAVAAGGALAAQLRRRLFLGLGAALGDLDEGADIELNDLPVCEPGQLAVEAQ